MHPIAGLQIEYSLMSRGLEAEILPTARELGIGITAYGVLSRGLLGSTSTQGLGASDFRAHAPRWQGDNLKKNLQLVEALKSLAQRKGATAAQLAIAWVLSRGKDIIPLIGARTRARLRESLGALDLKLGTADLQEIERAVPAERVAGERYPETGMRSLDSERRA